MELTIKEHEFVLHHKQKLLKEDGSSHPMILKSLEYMDTFEDAISECIQTGDYQKYVETITEYDQYLWTCNYKEKQKSNPINITQNKKYSSYRENLLYPIFVRVKNRLNFSVEVILDEPVVQVMFSDGSVTFKNVDMGLAVIKTVNGNTFKFPVVTDEDKAGQLCKTTAQNATAINGRFKKMNPSVITLISTDNHVTIGKREDSFLLNGTDILFPIRENNLKNKVYNKLNWRNFQRLEELLVKTLNQKGSESFDISNYKTSSKSGKIIRESVDNGDLFVNF
jgi:hypothetical protein